MSETSGPSRRAASTLVVLVAVLLLAAAAMISIAALQNTSQVDEGLKRTGDLVIANIRTVTQTQRELMKLEMLMRLDSTDKKEIDTRLDIIESRTRESTLPYQKSTLGNDALLQQSRTNKYVWETQVRPLVENWRDRGPGWKRNHAKAIQRVSKLENSYNNLAASGEANRQQSAEKAKTATQTLVDKMRPLVYLVVAAFFSALLMLLVGGYLIRRLLYDRAAANAQLQAVNTELEEAANILRATNTMLTVTDTEGRITWANDAFLAVLGWQLDDILGRRPADFLSGPETSPQLRIDVDDAMARQAPVSGEVAVYTKDGSRLWISILGSPVHSDGEMTGYVYVYSDVTKREEAAHLLVQARQAAEETAKEKGAFLATMSHEIRTPLNAVLGLTDLLRMTDLNPEQRTYTETAHRSGKHLLALLNDILDFSALESGEITLEARPFDLIGTITGAVSILGTSARAKGLDLIDDLSPDLPSAVVGDEIRLRQILLNLVSNAVKFTEKGTVAVRTDIDPDFATQDGAKAVRIRVEDSGIGITPEQAARLFQPFRQGDTSTTRRFGGTGLGLAICRQLAEAMGGTISIATPEGHQGTVVELTIPFAVATTAAVEESGEEEGTEASSGEGIRVLIAEDDPVNRTVITAMLKRFGIKPTLVENGKLAVDAVESDEWDLLMLDLQMPVMDGFTAARAIRASERGKDLYIVAVTADASVDAREQIRDAGINDYLGKPLNLKSLGELLNRVPGVGSIVLR